MNETTPPVRALGPLCILLLFAGCRDLSRFSSGTGHYEGDIVAGSFVRAGLAENARICLSFDAGHLQDAPGTLRTSDGRFRDALLRPIPQVWHDPLSTLSFGEGRVQNLVYAATPNGHDAKEPDVLVILSLMQDGSLEARLLRGAPAVDHDGTSPAGEGNLFGVFTLTHESTASCSF